MTITNNLNNLINPTIIVSVVGIISSVLFLFKKTNFYFLAIIWIIVQIPFFESDSFKLDFSQFLNFHFSIIWGNISLGLNAQIFLLFFVKTLLLSELLFRKISFKAYSENDKLKRKNEYSFIPTDIVEKKLVGESAIEIDNITYSKIELKPVKSERIKKAGITMVSSNEVEKINALIEYKLN